MVNVVLGQSKSERFELPGLERDESLDSAELTNRYLELERVPVLYYQLQNLLAV